MISYMCFPAMHQPNAVSAGKRMIIFSNRQYSSSVPSEECPMMLGDFNVHVGSRVCGDDEWWYERGPHGYLHEAGRVVVLPQYQHGH